MRALSDWRSSKYLAAQRASKARRAAEEVRLAIFEIEDASMDYGVWLRDRSCSMPVRPVAAMDDQRNAALERIAAAHCRMVKAAGE